MNIRVLLITCEFPPHVGGIATHVAELARGLATEVDAVAVVDPQDFFLGNGADTPTGSCTVHRPRLLRAQPFYRFALGRWLRRMVSRSGANIVHVHGVRPLGATCGLDVPVVFTNHSSGFLGRLKASPQRQARTAQLLQHVNHVIGPSDELVEASRSFGFEGRATMIPNGVDPRRFHPGATDLRAKLRIKKDETVILLARRLAAKNGVLWFANALPLLRHLPFHVLIAGDGEERAPLMASLKENDLLDRTTFLGAVANKDMPDVYRASDIAVLPSLAEATSIAGLEAMASALPLVGTRVGGIPAIIDDGATGFLVAPHDSQALSLALRQLIASSDLRSRLGSAARAKVQREFAWPIIVRKTVEVYRESLRSTVQ